MRNFAQLMRSQHRFKAEEVLGYLRQAKYKKSVLQVLKRPPEKKASWLDYKARFVNADHLREGKKFIKQHRKLLNRAHKEFGVPPHIIAAIIGVETNYGRLLGSYRTLDVLATIAFSDYRRADFFREQLVEFMLLARAHDRNPASYTSSYAGAMGFGQFLPSSYRKYGVDFDGDGSVNLAKSIADAIGSIGNYLRAFGWEKNAPVMLKARRDAANQKEIKYNSSFLPNTSIKEAKDSYGTDPLRTARSRWKKQDKVTFLRFAKEQPELWLGMHNYYVLSRYNHSHFYVMSLYLLGEGLSS